MRVLIEVYRKWEIFFDTNKEEFYTTSNEYDTEKVKRSYASAKKFIDDYIKDNETFTPIWVQRLYDSDKPIKIVGVRKDGAFVYEDRQGKKAQFTNYDEGRYFLVNPANDYLFEKIADLTSKRRAIDTEIKELEGKVTMLMVKDYRKELEIEDKTN